MDPLVVVMSGREAELGRIRRHAQSIIAKVDEDRKSWSRLSVTHNPTVESIVKDVLVLEEDLKAIVSADADVSHEIATLKAELRTAREDLVHLNAQRDAHNGIAAQLQHREDQKAEVKRKGRFFGSKKTTTSSLPPAEMLLQGPPPLGANITYNIQHMSNQHQKGGLAIHGGVNMGTKTAKAAGAGTVHNGGTLVDVGLRGYGGYSAINDRKGKG
jgi:hypothetical protein